MPVMPRLSKSESIVSVWGLIAEYISINVSFSFWVEVATAARRDSNGQKRYKK